MRKEAATQIETERPRSKRGLTEIDQAGVFIDSRRCEGTASVQFALTYLLSAAVTQVLWLETKKKIEAVSSKKEAVQRNNGCSICVM